MSGGKFNYKNEVADYIISEELQLDIERIESMQGRDSAATIRLDSAKQLKLACDFFFQWVESYDLAASDDAAFDDSYVSECDKLKRGIAGVLSNTTRGIGSMNYNLKKPCSSCPFRTDIRPFLMPERAEDIANAILDRQETFPCHMTTVDNGDGERVQTGSSEHCAGALIMLEHMERPNQMMRIAERLGMYDRRNLKMDSPVFGDADEWIDTQGVW